MGEESARKTHTPKVVRKDSAMWGFSGPHICVSYPGISSGVPTEIRAAKTIFHVSGWPARLRSTVIAHSGWIRCSC
jgi:hypothetical protein